MLQLFSYGLLARAFAFLGALLFFLLSLASPDASPWRLVVWIVRVGTFLYIALVVLNLTGRWRALWTRCTFLQRFYPDLQGTWRGKVVSNYLSWKTGQIDPQFTKPITLRIFAGLFSIKVLLETDDNYSSSETLFVQPVRRDEGVPARLRYLYKNTTVDPKPTDEQYHLGAAELTVTDNDPPTLRGPYWTNRCWHQGQNTAGTIEVTRISCDPYHPVRKGTAATPEG